MKNNINKVKGSNYAAINIGSLNEIGQYIYPHPKLKQNIPGKLFTSELLQTTGMEISFQEMPPHMQIPFLHAHKEHEEVYIFLKGHGEFQVDDELIEIKEGSIIKVAPAGKRSWRNNSDTAMVFIVIQAKADTMERFEVNDGYGVKGTLMTDKA